MRILYHHRTGSKDGQAVHIEELVAALGRLGHEVIMVEPPVAAATGFGGDSGLIAWIRRHLPRAVGELLELVYNVPTYLRLRRAFLAHRPDFLYERHNLYLLAGAWLKRRHKVPYLLEVNAPLFRERQAHGGLGLPALARLTEAWVWRQADYLLPVTGVLARIIEESGVPSERVVVIPNGIDPERFRDFLPLDSAKRKLGLEGCFVLGFTGFVREWNRLDRVIDYVARPDNGACRLVVVGDGPAVPALKARAKRLEVEERVRFVGVVDRDAVRDWVAAFDVALLPAVTEYASPLKLFEYLALGRAIVAPSQPNLCEILRHGENAMLFDADSEAGLSQALDAMKGDAARRAALGRAAARSIEAAGLTWARNASRVCALASTGEESETHLAAGARKEPARGETSTA